MKSTRCLLFEEEKEEEEHLPSMSKSKPFDQAMQEMLLSGKNAETQFNTCVTSGVRFEHKKAFLMRIPELSCHRCRDLAAVTGVYCQTCLSSLCRRCAGLSSSTNDRTCQMCNSADSLAKWSGSNKQISVTCRACKTRVLVADVLNHLAVCPWRTCPVCQAVVDRNSPDDHCLSCSGCKTYFAKQ